MVTGQLTRSEAEAALKRLQGLKDDWERQRNRWSGHHQKAADIKALQRYPSAPLIYTVECCCNQMDELERLIQDFRACALYLVHLPIPEGPDASFRSALPDLWSIPHAAPGTTAVALPGQVAGFSAQMAPVQAIQGLSDQIQMYNTYTGSGAADHNAYYGSNQMMSGGMMSGQMTGYQPAQNQNSFQSQPTSSFQSPAGNMMGFQPRPTNIYSSQPLPPQHTQALYNQQMAYQQQAADQSRINQFSSTVFQPQQGFQPQNYNPQHSSNASPLNPFNPNAPHGAVLDASQRYPAVQ